MTKRKTSYNNQRFSTVLGVGLLATMVLVVLLAVPQLKEKQTTSSKAAEEQSSGDIDSTTCLLQVPKPILMTGSANFYIHSFAAIYGYWPKKAYVVAKLTVDGRTLDSGYISCGSLEACKNNIGRLDFQSKALVGTHKYCTTAEVISCISQTGKNIHRGPQTSPCFTYTYIYK